MQTPNNSQQVNEQLDRLHHEYPGRYVLIIAERGAVTWYENHESALRDQNEYGGIVIDTATADAEYIQRCVENAMRQI